MATKILLSRPGTPLTKNGYEGFSWTTFLWGPFPPLFRADGIGFLIAVPLTLLSFMIPIVPFLIWAFFYNKNHFDRQLQAGWVPVPTYPIAGTHPGYVVGNHPAPAPHGPQHSLGPSPDEWPQPLDTAHAPHSPGPTPPAPGEHLTSPLQEPPLQTPEPAPAAAYTVDSTNQPSNQGRDTSPDWEAGWYPDPYSATGERWWDGSGWTERCR